MRQMEPFKKFIGIYFMSRFFDATGCALAPPLLPSKDSASELVKSMSNLQNFDVCVKKMTRSGSEKVAAPVGTKWS